MGRLLARVAATDPAAGVCKLPQPFRMIDKLLSGIIDDATNLALERERQRLAAQGIVEGTQVYLPSAVADDVGAVACLAASEDGRRAFAGVEDGSIIVIDASTGVATSRVVAFPDRPVLAVDVVTARPPPPDAPFWHPERTADEDASAAEETSAEGGAEGGAEEGAEGDGSTDSNDAAANSNPDDANEGSPAPLFDLAEIAAAAGGPTPRDAVPVSLVAVACADAARVYVSEPTTGRLTLLASAAAPEGGAAAELRFAPDGRTLALAAEGGGFAVFAVPAPTPEAYYPEPEPEPEPLPAEDATTEPAAEEGETAAEEAPREDETAVEEGDDDAAADAAADDATETDARMVPLVWLPAANAAAAFGFAPRPVGDETTRTGKDDDGGEDDAEAGTDADAEADADADAGAGADAGDAEPPAEPSAEPSESTSSAAVRAKAPFVRFRLAGASADAAYVAWPGCNRVAMFQLRGSRVVPVAHDHAPALRGEASSTAAAREGDDAAEGDDSAEGADADAAAADADAADAAGAGSNLSGSAAPEISSPTCDWTSPFPVSAAASSDDGARFAVGAADGSVLLFDARLAIVRRAFDRLGSVGAAHFRREAADEDDDDEARARAARDGNAAFDEPAEPTACASLAFRRDAGGRTTLAAASAAGWTAVFDVDDGNENAGVAVRVVRPRGEPHVAETMTCQRRGAAAVVTGASPPPPKPDDDGDDDENDGRDDDDDDPRAFEDARDANAAKRTGDGSESSSPAPAFVRLLDLDGATDLYGVLSPPEGYAFARGRDGKVICHFAGRDTVLVGATEIPKPKTEPEADPKETNDAGEDAPTPTPNENENENENENDNGDGDGGEAKPEQEEETVPEGDAEGEGETGEGSGSGLGSSDAGSFPGAVVVTAARICVYRVPSGGGADDRPGVASAPRVPLSWSVPPESRAHVEDFHRSPSPSLVGDDPIAAKRSFGAGVEEDASSVLEPPSDPVAERLARLVGAGGGAAARRARVAKRVADLEKRLQRRALVERGAPVPAPGALSAF